MLAMLAFALARPRWTRAPNLSQTLGTMETDAGGNHARRGRQGAPRKALWVAGAAALLVGTTAVTSLGLRPEDPPGSLDLGAWLDGFDTGPTVEEAVRGFEEQLQIHHLNPNAVVRLSDDYAVVAAAGESRVRVMELYRLPGGQPHARELAGGEHAGRVPAFILETLSGDTGQEWNTVFYGTAPSYVSRVVVDGLDYEGGEVIGRAWVVVLRDKGVQPEELHWRFVDAEGNTVLQGIGLTPAE